MRTLQPTLNPLPPKGRAQVVEFLNDLMADILDNHYQSLLAHWNTRGSNFAALHKLFEQYGIGNGAENWCDLVAERISQLGGTVLTTIPYIAANTSLREYPLNIREGAEHAEALAKSAAKIIARLCEGINLAEKHGDRVTAYILGEVQQSAEKWLWLLEAHLPSPPHQQ